MLRSVPLVTLAVGSLIASPLAADNDSMTQTVSVSGEGKVVVIADIAEVVLGIEATASSPEDAQSKVAQIQKRVMDALSTHSSVEKLESHNTSVYPQYDRNDRNRITGYIARIDLHLDTGAKEAGELIALALRRGATHVRRVSLRADDQTLDAARKEAIQLAAQRALAEGQMVMEALKLTYQGIDRVQIGGPSHVPIFRSYKAEAASFDAAPNMDITEQELDVQANVSLVLRYI